MDISFLYKKKVAIDLWQWHCRNRGEKNKIVGFHCFLTSCLLCMHHLRTYQCCWCTNWNLFVQGKLHFFHCFLTSCLLGMHHSQISIKYRMLFCRSVLCNYCPKRSSFLQIFFFPPILAMPLPQNFFHNFPPLFWQCYCHKSMATFFFFFKKWYVHIIFTIFLQQILNSRLLLVVIIGLKK